MLERMQCNCAIHKLMTGFILTQNWKCPWEAWPDVPHPLWVPRCPRSRGQSGEGLSGRTSPWARVSRAPGHLRLSGRLSCFPVPVNTALTTSAPSPVMFLQPGTPTLFRGTAALWASSPPSSLEITRTLRAHAARGQGTTGDPERIQHQDRQPPGGPSGASSYALAAGCPGPGRGQPQESRARNPGRGWHKCTRETGAATKGLSLWGCGQTCPRPFAGWG